MANHPNRGNWPSPTADEVKRARNQVGLTQTQAANVVKSSLRAWQAWEDGTRNMPAGLRELFSLKTGAYCYAVYTSDAILGVGESIKSAVIDSQIDAPVVRMSLTDSYEGGIVDFTDAQIVSPNSEAVSGADAKIRRCTVRIYQQVLANGSVPFEINDRGVLDILDGE